jgi:hypothetical protein
MESGDFECVECVPVPDALSLTPRRGREYLARWKLDATRFPRIHTETLR